MSRTSIRARSPGWPATPKRIVRSPRYSMPRSHSTPSWFDGAAASLFGKKLDEKEISALGSEQVPSWQKVLIFWDFSCWPEVNVGPNRPLPVRLLEARLYRAGRGA